MTADKISKAISIYRTEGLGTLAITGWSFVGNRVWNILERVPVVRYFAGVFLPLQPGKSIWTYAASTVGSLLHGQPRDIETAQLSTRPLWIDRASELALCLDCSIASWMLFFIINGPPNSLYFEHRMNPVMGEHFGPSDHTPDPEELLEAYRAVSLWNASRLMLGYHRYEVARRFRSVVDRQLDSLTILDYGCGVADTAVYFGAQGCDVTIVDLDTVLLDLAECRLLKREIPYTVYRASQTESPIEVEEADFDLVIMSEFLEHVKDPMKFLQFAVDHLADGGYMYDPVGRDFDHQIHGQHLKEAKETVESEQYQRLHRENFQRISEDIYRKGTPREG